jgi:hypothetical protein
MDVSNPRRTAVLNNSISSAFRSSCLSNGSICRTTCETRPRMNDIPRGMTVPTSSRDLGQCLAVADPVSGQPPRISSISRMVLPAIHAMTPARTSFKASPVSRSVFFRPVAASIELAISSRISPRASISAASHSIVQFSQPAISRHDPEADRTSNDRVQLLADRLSKHSGHPLEVLNAIFLSRCGLGYGHP